MTRLILLALFVAAVLVAVTSVMALFSASDRSAGRTRNSEETMPQTIQTIAYVALIILMFGVVSGWLGGG